jgi:trk system potassium uptake protein TrkA
MELGYEVLGVDEDEDLVEKHSDALTQVMISDTTTEQALREIGATEAVTVVVCIGSNIEASVLTTAALADLGVKNVWAKANTEAHASILRRVGARHVVTPEADMGARVAHLVTGPVLEFLELDTDFVLAALKAPTELAGLPLGESDLRAEYKVTVVCVKPEGGRFTYAGRDTVLGMGDLIVIAGHSADVERFTKRN